MDINKVLIEDLSLVLIHCDLLLLLVLLFLEDLHLIDDLPEHQVSSVAEGNHRQLVLHNEELLDEFLVTVEDEEQLVVDGVVDANVVLLVGKQVSSPGSVLDKRAPYQVDVLDQLEAGLKYGKHFEPCEKCGCQKHPRRMHGHIDQDLVLGLRVKLLLIVKLLLFDDRDDLSDSIA